MSTLAQLQHDFIRAFYHKEPELFTQHLSTAPTIDQEKQWQIYRDSITEGLAQHLRIVYAACVKLVGDDFFTGLAYKFIQKVPCCHDNLSTYGGELPEFISTFPAAAQLPYLADFSRLCWYRYCCQQQQQYCQFDMTQFSLVDPQQYEYVRLLLQPTYYLLQSPYPLDQIWALCHDADQQTDQIDLTTNSIHLFIFWDQDHISCKRISEQDYIIMQYLAEKPTLSELQQQLIRHDINLQEKLPYFLQQRWLGSWVIQ